MRLLPPSTFPRRLLEIPEPPKQLYIEGTLPGDDYIFLAVVGARKYSSYGKEVCEKLIAGLRGQKVVIVSGLALGIDAIAHRAALGAHLPTIAIPGSGLSRTVLYPSTHARLADEIVQKGGALLSEFEPEHVAAPWTFIQRNRIMAGLSHSVLIIEAERKSGTLVTARLATEYNRNVCAVPGSIFSKTSEGPHFLIRLGATPIASPEDLLEALGLEATQPAPADEQADCSKEERQILQFLATPRTRDEIMEQLPFSPQQTNALLSLLEIKGLTKESGGTLWRA